MVLIQIERPDLVISDISMPKMDGFMLAERVAERFPNLPMIALSGNVGPKDVEGHNFVGFVGKPMQIEELRTALGAVLAKNE